MLIAISEITSTRVMADDVDRTHPCRCPECCERLIYKNGAVVTRHFAHYARTQCSLSEGESPRHLQMKRDLWRMFRAEGIRAKLEWEWAPGRRADIVLPEVDTVVECQASPISIIEWDERTRDYNQQGTAVLWVWDICRVFGSRKIIAFPPNYELGPPESWKPEDSRAPEYRVPAEIRHCHDMCAEHVNSLDHSGVFKVCRFLDAEERFNEWYDDDGELQERWYTPKTLRRIHTASPEEVVNTPWA